MDTFLSIGVLLIFLVTFGQGDFPYPKSKPPESDYKKDAEFRRVGRMIVGDINKRLHEAGGVIFSSNLSEGPLSLACKIPRSDLAGLEIDNVVGVKESREIFWIKGRLFKPEVKVEGQVDFRLGEVGKRKMFNSTSTTPLAFNFAVLFTLKNNIEVLLLEKTGDPVKFETTIQKCDTSFTSHFFTNKEKQKACDDAAQFVSRKLQEVYPSKAEMALRNILWRYFKYRPIQ